MHVLTWLNNGQFILLFLSHIWHSLPPCVAHCLDEEERGAVVEEVKNNVWMKEGKEAKGEKEEEEEEEEGERRRRRRRRRKGRKGGGGGGGKGRKGGKEDKEEGMGTQKKTNAIAMMPRRFWCRYFSCLTLFLLPFLSLYVSL